MRSGSRGQSANGLRLCPPARSSPASVAPRPRVAAPSSMSGASWPTQAAECGCSMSVRVSGRVVRRRHSGLERWRHGDWVLRFGIRASVGRVAATGSRLAPPDPVRRRWSSNVRRPLHAAAFIATFRCDAPGRVAARSPMGSTVASVVATSLYSLLIRGVGICVSNPFLTNRSNLDNVYRLCSDLLLAVAFSPGSVWRNDTMAGQRLAQQDDAEC